MPGVVGFGPRVPSGSRVAARIESGIVWIIADVVRTIHRLRRKNRPGEGNAGIEVFTGVEKTVTALAIKASHGVYPRDTRVPRG